MAHSSFSLFFLTLLAHSSLLTLLAGMTSGADCSACPDFTTTAGATGRISSGECVCQEGYYLDEKSGASSEDGSCVQCDAMSMNCTQSNVTLSMLPAAQGFYRKSTGSKELLRCDNPEDCVGGTSICELFCRTAELFCRTLC